jgi:5-formyltetrahydrofolate cyclo-ligase
MWSKGVSGGPRVSDAADLRQELRRARRKLTGAELAAASERVAAELTSLLGAQRPGRIATYLASDGELDPNVAAAQLRAAGWELHLPVLVGRWSMTFVEWIEHAELVENRYGIPEPRTDVEHAARRAAELDVVLLPAVALDGSGNRMGMGAGFYDRTLEGVRGRDRAPLLVGIAHDAALVDALEPAPWDVPVDVVLTDRRVLRPARA